jgi:hypothetical protein
MTLQKRRTAFYSLLALFVIFGGAVILYSTGWRLDFRTMKIEKVGAILVKSFPSDAEISLNGKPVQNETGLLRSGTLIGNLFPTNYKLKLSTNNFKTWEENISVSPSMVTEVNAVLVPQGLDAVATGTIQNFWLLNGGLIVKNQSGSLLVLDGSLSSPGSGEAEKKIGKGDVINWTGDSEYVLAFNQNTGVYSWNDLLSGTSVNLNSALKKAGLDVKPGVSIWADPSDKRRLVVSGKTKIYLFDVENLSLTNIYKAASGTTPGPKIAPSQFYLAWTQFNSAQNTSTIIVYDKFLRRPLGNTAEFKGANKEIEWMADKKIAVLQEDGELYLYDPSDGASTKLADDVKEFALSGDGSAVAALGNNALEIIPLNQDQNYHRFNLPEKDTIEGIYWYADNEHLFVSYPDHISFLDLNDAGLSNFATVATGTMTSAYDTDANRLYILKNDGLFGMDFPN